ncbi:MAG: methyltransferase domain-containing protein [Oscillospiraceae bacterium]|nr:methyltransferase domain-containing protein [Oscillospiraceae bacterium]
MEVKKLLEEYYSGYDEDGRLGSRHGSVEYLTTMRYIEKYLRPGMRILEIGAGTGRYSHALARKGHPVDAVELIQHNIEIFERNTTASEQITITQGDARDLSRFGDDTYDITLLLGPMYHLFTVDDQRRALSEAIRVTKDGGVIFAAYCGNDATIVQFCFQRGMIRDERYRALVDPVTFKAGSDPSELFQLYRREDIDALMEGFPVRRLRYVGSDLATNYMRTEIDAMEDELFQLYLSYHFSVCERADLVGASHHILDVFRKGEDRC